MMQDSLDVLENYSGLLFVAGQAHDGQSLAKGDELTEVAEAGHEARDESTDETFSATTTDDEIRFLAAAQRWGCAAGVRVKDDQVVNAHRQVKDGFQDDHPRSPGVQRTEAGQGAEYPLVLNRLDDVGSPLHCIS